MSEDYPEYFYFVGAEAGSLNKYKFVGSRKDNGHHFKGATVIVGTLEEVIYNRNDRLCDLAQRFCFNAKSVYWTLEEAIEGFYKKQQEHIKYQEERFGYWMKNIEFGEKRLVDERIAHKEQYEAFLNKKPVNLDHLLKG